MRRKPEAGSDFGVADESGRRFGGVNEFGYVKHGRVEHLQLDQSNNEAHLSARFHSGVSGSCAPSLANPSHSKLNADWSLISIPKASSNAANVF